MAFHNVVRGRRLSPTSPPRPSEELLSLFENGETGVLSSSLKRKRNASSLPSPVNSIPAQESGKKRLPVKGEVTLGIDPSDTTFSRGSPRLLSNVRRSPRSNPQRGASEPAAENIPSIKTKSSEKGSIKSLSQGHLVPRRKMAAETVEHPKNEGDSQLLTGAANTDSDTEFEVESQCLDVSDEQLSHNSKVSSESSGSINLRRKDPRATPSKPEIGVSEKPNNRKEPPHQECFFVGDPIPEDEAQKRWLWRYNMKSKILKAHRKSEEFDDEDEIITDVKCHYRQAEVTGCIFDIGDCAYIMGEGGNKHVGRILEFFQTTQDKDYFRVQWFYRAEDTVMQGQASYHSKRRLFYSNVMNDNPLDCIISKVKISRFDPLACVQSSSNSHFDFYYDMEYSLEYSTFCNLRSDIPAESLLPSTPSSIKVLPQMNNKIPSDFKLHGGSAVAELSLLDLFCGCGGMSTGLELGAKLCSINLVTKWALDHDEFACKSLNLNHPEVQIRNESADDFLHLLREWEKLCKRFAADCDKKVHELRPKAGPKVDSTTKGDKNHAADAEVADGEFEVSSLVDICYGDPNETGHRGLHFKVRWKGYGSNEDTWEPIEGLRKCDERIREFVRKGYKSEILPLPGKVGVICGGPPCQGISGYNRYRNVDAPLEDARNRQIVVFMDIVQFLKPKFVLMENVTDILRLDKASLARYALSRLVHMRYQTRLGTIAAGSYGLPQFRLRVFLWGAHPKEKLPLFPLPTHEVIVRYWPPLEFERNTVAYYEDYTRHLEKAAILQDAISDLPPVLNYETREEMPYGRDPETEFQRFIRSPKHEMTGSHSVGCTKTMKVLNDHRPYVLGEDNYMRVCHIPKRKGANFRDLPGLLVKADNTVQLDSNHEQVLLPSGNPLIPNFVFTMKDGKSKRPFSRLWWDETMPTVLTDPNCRVQAILHPEQDRILTIRECARLQGFPDYYRFCGSLRDRYRQIGNAVAVPVGRALGYALGMAYLRESGDEPHMILPPKFSTSTYTDLMNCCSKEACGLGEAKRGDVMVTA
ncbi:hypothetical protein MLD38_027827 [Melastoma candidum]|uniref:Uncharacterized protein n=1 Tax=Melastoma candidum TaxID=119954 RepID=A0ACB9P2Z1_9MYRT|nr:hypothetical protein MLD38_027827 [Melastoma candidum]